MSNPMCVHANDCAQIRFWKTAFSLNPNGIPQQSPGLRGTSSPGVRRRRKQQPQRGCDPQCTFTKAETPLGFCLSDPLPQGRSFLATLGFETQSLWDWQTFKI